MGFNLDDEKDYWGTNVSISDNYLSLSGVDMQSQ